MRPNKLECLYLAISFQSSLAFAGNTRSLPKKEASEGPPIGLALISPSNSKTWLERVSKDKHYSIAGLVVSDEGKKFYNMATWSIKIDWTTDLNFVFADVKNCRKFLENFLFVIDSWTK